MQFRTRRVLLRPLSCCLLIFALLILPLDAQSIWWDEGINLHLAGEIIRDTHVLTWSPAPGELSDGSDPAVSGPAALRVGLYDGEIGVRVLWHDGQDALQLPILVTVVVSADDGH